MLHNLCITTKPRAAQENFVRFLLTFHGSNRNILRSCIAHARYWARVRVHQGKVPQVLQRRLNDGNEEEGHQEGCQKEKAVTDRGEAIGLALFLSNENGLRNVVSRRPFSFAKTFSVYGCPSRCGSQSPFVGWVGNGGTVNICGELKSKKPFCGSVMSPAVASRWVSGGTLKRVSISLRIAV